MWKAQIKNLIFKIYTKFGPNVRRNHTELWSKVQKSSSHLYPHAKGMSDFVLSVKDMLPSLSCFS